MFIDWVFLGRPAQDCGHREERVAAGAGRQLQYRPAAWLLAHGQLQQQRQPAGQQLLL